MSKSNQLLGCVICEKKFDTFNELRRHKRIHAEKPYSCPSCDQRFNNFGSQQKHTKTHSHDEMNCEKENPTADEEKMHDETEAFSCTQCDKTLGKKPFRIFAFFLGRSIWTFEFWIWKMLLYTILHIILLKFCIYSFARWH